MLRRTAVVLLQLGQQAVVQDLTEVVLLLLSLLVEGLRLKDLSVCALVPCDSVRCFLVYPVLYLTVLPSTVVPIVLLLRHLTGQLVLKEVALLLLEQGVSARRQFVDNFSTDRMEVVLLRGQAEVLLGDPREREHPRLLEPVAGRQVAL